MQNINCHCLHACSESTTSASSLSIALLRKLCIPPILSVKYLLLITYYPGGWLLFSRFYGQMSGSVYLFLGFISGIGMRGVIYLFPLVEKSHFPIEIPVNRFFCMCVCAFRQNPACKVPPYVTHTPFSTLRTPFRANHVRQLRPVAVCLAIPHTTWFQDEFALVLGTVEET